MDRISAPNATVDHKFRDANPGTGQQATFFNAAWCNGLQEELVAGLIEPAGLTPNPAVFDQVRKAIFLLVYPVGSLYWTADLAFNPATYFGGAWTKVSVGRMPVGYDVAQAEFNAVGNQGGEKTHALTTAEMPKHFHKMLGPNNVTNPQGVDGGASGVYGGGTPDDATQAYNTYSTGGSAVSGDQATGTSNGTAHNNLPPYEVTGNIWKRTA